MQAVKRYFQKKNQERINLHNIAKFLQNKDVNLKVLNQNIDTRSSSGGILVD